jgi:hypothetical protein
VGLLLESLKIINRLLEMIQISAPEIVVAVDNLLSTKIPEEYFIGVLAVCKTIETRFSLYAGLLQFDINEVSDSVGIEW